MDKNMIKIDELVRNRLSGAEEREPAGAWNNMRALLDKEMPTQTPVFPWKKVTGYATLLLLVSSLSVGGYHYLRKNAQQSAQTVAINSTSPKGEMGNPKTQEQQESTISTNPAPLAVATGKQLKSKTNKSSISTLPHLVGSARPAGLETAKNTQSRDAENAILLPKSDQAKNSQTAVIKSVQNFSQNRDEFAGIHEKASSKNQDVAKNSAQLKPTANNQLNGLVVSETNTSIAAPATSNDHLENPAPKTRTEETISALKTAGFPKLQEQDMPASMPLATGSATLKEPIRLNTSVPETNVLKDTIRQIELTYRAVRKSNSQSTVYRMDTLSVTKIAVDKPKKPIASANPQTSVVAASPRKRLMGATNAPVIAKNNVQPVVVPQSMPNAYASENIELVSLSKFKVASRFRNVWNSEHFNLMIMQVKTELSKAQFYAGITGGINASLFGGTSLAGLQAGITGLLALNEHWSIAGDLKFYQRFNTGGSIQDAYVKVVSAPVSGNYTTVNGVAYREWSWKQDTVGHSYNFTSIQTLELPVLLRYNAGRVFVEAGLNMMYAFGVNVDEIDRPFGTPEAVSRLLPAATTQETISGSAKGINPGDFGSRFGIGYALGAGFECTPALNLNCRVVQSFWDNATSPGAQKVSHILYQKPSIQISVGYRFRQGKGK